MTGFTGSELAHEVPYQADLALKLHRHSPKNYPFLLESAADGTPQGRYDILFAFPGERLILDEEFHLEGPGSAAGLDFLQALNAWWQHEHLELAPSSIPFRGGWFLYLSYELAAQVETTLKLHQPRGLPVAAAVRVKTSLIIDRQEKKAWLQGEPGSEEILDQISSDLAKTNKDAVDEYSDDGLLETGLEEEPAQRYLDAVARTKRYIVDGDVFQVNLSREWTAKLRDDKTALDLYRRLRCSNPGPFAGLMTWGDQAVISSSPERLVQVRGGAAQTRPIAGTRPRNEDATIDRHLSAELINHPKERAEHIMLIDLERNDLGRICVPGSVEVDELMVIESYAHVHHIVSNIKGRLRPDVLPGDAIRAVFPGGTITGCPKVRCMEIIDELEQVARGPYTGSIGYLNRDGSLDLNILIRTLHLDGHRLSFRAGGGIVADSQADAEVEETRAKARGLVLAIEGESL
jgi:anthranilate synthase component 1